MKFKIGDKVKVKADNKYEGEKYAGKVATIREIFHKCVHPYKLEFELKDNLCPDLFCAIELQLVTEEE